MHHSPVSGRWGRAWGITCVFIEGFAIIGGLVSFLAGLVYDTGGQRFEDFAISALCALAYTGAKRVTDRDPGS